MAGRCERDWLTIAGVIIAGKQTTWISDNHSKRVLVSSLMLALIYSRGGLEFKPMLNHAALS